MCMVCVILCVVLCAVVAVYLCADCISVDLPHRAQSPAHNKYSKYLPGIAMVYVRVVNVYDILLEKETESVQL